MLLKNETILELKGIVRDEFGTDVDDADASKIGNIIVRVFDMLAEIDHRSRSEINGQQEKSPTK